MANQPQSGTAPSIRDLSSYRQYTKISVVCYRQISPSLTSNFFPGEQSDSTGKHLLLVNTIYNSILFVCWYLFGQFNVEFVSDLLVNLFVLFEIITQNSR